MLEKFNDVYAKLRTPEGLQANINSQGAYLESLVDAEGNHLLLPRQEVESESKNRGGVFLCAPNFGPGDAIGQPQHGFARQLSWTRDDTYDDTTAKFLLTQPAEDPKGMVGALYQGCNMQLEFRLKNEGQSSSLIINLEAENNGEEPFVFTPGFHPYFPADHLLDPSITINDGLKAYTTDLSLLETAKVPDLSENGFVTFQDGRNEISIRTNNLSVPILWTATPSKYFCVEPTFASSATANDAVLDKAEYKLQPGEKRAYDMEITWSPLQ